MLKKIVVIILLFAGCKTGNINTISNSQDNRILFTVNNTPVTAEEFKYVYNKNNFNSPEAFSKDDIKNYFDLFLNFKLKIEEAKSTGMHETKEFKEELDGYLVQLKKPYLSENEVTKRLIKEAYDRYNQEIRASHILISIENGDTLSAYNKASELRKKIVDGASFAEVAIANSDDPSVRINKGDLGYFTSFQMVYPFESAAYKTAVGQISDPARTQFGYHLVYVKDKRPANGKVQVSHIMLKHTSDSASVKNKIFDIYEQATGGVDWNELVKQYSDDVNSKNTNGILRPFGVAQMPFIFQEAAFQLENPDQISDPIKTKYGWHIIKLVKKIPIESFEKLEPTISSRIEKDVRSQQNEKVLIQRLKRENGFSENKEVWEVLLDKVDDSLVKGSWAPNIASFSEETLFTVGKNEISVNEFVEYVKSDGKTSSSTPEIYAVNLYHNFKNEQIIGYEESLLEEKYIDYRMLVKEYREGIMLFQLMEDEVWNKASEDSIGLQNFYEVNKEKYQWDRRADVNLYSSSDVEIINKVKEAIQMQDSSFLTKENIYKKYNSGASVSLQLESGIFEEGIIEILDQSRWEVGVEQINYAGKTHLVWIKNILEPRTKELNEAKGAVISDYQNQLEKEWLIKLRDKYTVSINDDVLNKIYEELAK